MKVVLSGPFDDPVVTYMDAPLPSLFTIEKPAWNARLNLPSFSPRTYKLVRVENSTAYYDEVLA